MRNTAIGSAMLLGMLLSSASGQTPPKAECKPAPDLKRGDLFGPDKLWTIHLKLGAKEYAALLPKRGGVGFPFPKKDKPPKKGEKTDAEPPDIHKNHGFGLEFPWVKGDLEFDGRLIKDVGIRYKGNATYGVSQQTLKRPFKIDINHYRDAQQLHGLNGFALGNNAFDPTRLHDALAYHLFRAAKLPASRTAFVELSLTVADKYDKTYVVVRPGRSSPQEHLLCSLRCCEGVGHLHTMGLVEVGNDLRMRLPNLAPIRFVEPFRAAPGNRQIETYRERHKPRGKRIFMRFHRTVAVTESALGIDFNPTVFTAMTR